MAVMGKESADRDEHSGAYKARSRREFDGRELTDESGCGFGGGEAQPEVRRTEAEVLGLLDTC
ncbi:hypothetical protein E2562_003745 [Oryza meyeriana var. granulata]|uniref:Uncharacterized protein n=1 Tax=Oryza meyeriana var. granulata TaxID=110450 RepID=A0A6G1BRF5_9ORYZ|nr:hypothetical protein E2562_003745 [Oryza meyeriana var. granulata]